jgi:hypothetical protein
MKFLISFLSVCGWWWWFFFLVFCHIIHWDEKTEELQKKSSIYHIFQWFFFVVEEMWCKERLQKKYSKVFSILDHNQPDPFPFKTSFVYISEREIDNSSDQVLFEIHCECLVGWKEEKKRENFLFFFSI